MDQDVAWVDGWEIRRRPDGSYGVYDSHSLLDGPFGTESEAMAAALRLPHPFGYRLRPPRVSSPIAKMPPAG